jgi:hypothetical protein
MRSVGLLAIAVSTTICAMTPAATISATLRDRWAKVEQIQMNERPTFDDLSKKLGKPRLWKRGSANSAGPVYAWYPFDSLSENGTRSVTRPMLTARFDKENRIEAFVRVKPYALDEPPVHSMQYDSAVYLHGHWQNLHGAGLLLAK